MNTKVKIIIAAVIVALIILINSLYVVNERQVAAVTQFQRLIKTDETAGLKMKVPFIQDVEYFDARMQRLDVDPELFLTNEKKYLIVDYFVIWRIGNVRQFYTSVQGNLDRASNLLDQLVKDGLRSEFVLRSVKEVISEDRGSIMNSVTASLQEDAKRYGVDIIGVRLKRVDFSDDIRDRVFDRMRAERERVSKSLRAQGREKSAVIRAAAEREAEGILAVAREQSQIMRGEADATAAKLFAEHYGKDLEFYQLWRSMQGYRAGMTGDNATLLISPDSQFWQYFHGSGEAASSEEQSSGNTEKQSEAASNDAAEESSNKQNNGVSLAKAAAEAGQSVEEVIAAAQPEAPEDAGIGEAHGITDNSDSPAQAASSENRPLEEVIAEPLEGGDRATLDQ
ncbi:protease modulator HflC [Cardiobacteriaceae bacterium TAE3-ERU3]|nr:protease modulator HflC [Cardiobacteriaceae bacterium TAE3-ERU3]